MSALTAFVILILFCLYLALYHGVFGLALSLLAGSNSLSRAALLSAPVVWVAAEFARTRISGFPWNLLGVTQVDNIPLARIARAAGVYGLSFEIMVVNTAVATAFLVRRDKRKALLLVSLGAALVLQAGRLVSPPPVPADRAALLVQQNIPVLDSSDWTREYFEGTLRDLSWISMRSEPSRPDLIVWPESPAPFYTSDPVFRQALSNLARQANAWVLAGSIGTRNAGHTQSKTTAVYNSAALVTPAGNWSARYDKIHLVPFGEYVPFRRIFAFASGLTEQVGDFTGGSSRAPLTAGNAKLGVFICYESIFPDDIRRFAANGAQVFVNISNDGWYGDSGAYAQHLKQARMRTVENARWLLRSTNTGVTASIDPYGRVVASLPRKLRAGLAAPYALSDVTTFYTAHGDWFAYLCAIICIGALLARFTRR
jgi:apolipoprotein N-acyltransferase